MKTELSAVASVLLLAGCSTSSALTVAPDRSRSQVVIRVVQESGREVASIEHMQQIATRQCRLIGYGATSPQIHVQSECVVTSEANACKSERVERTYSCQGNAIASQHVLPPETIVAGGH